MRKRTIQQYDSDARLSDTPWLAVNDIATVEVTSEAPAFEIENALLYRAIGGWRAAFPGDQTIRITFDKPQAIKRIWLHFLERQIERTQEFTLRWLPADGGDFREIVRQQWNFSPRGSVKEIEDYTVDLPAAKQLEIHIKPSQGNVEAYASLAQLRLA
jgi:hypothetical protein